MKVAELGSSAGLLGMGVFQGLVLENGRQTPDVVLVPAAPEVPPPPAAPPVPAPAPPLPLDAP